MTTPRTHNTLYGANDAAVSRFIDSFWKVNFRSPTIREIKEGCHISSTSVARTIIHRVAKTRGDHLTTDGSARGITPKWVRDAITHAQPH